MIQKLAGAQYAVLCVAMVVVNGVGGGGEKDSGGCVVYVFLGGQLEGDAHRVDGPGGRRTKIRAEPVSSARC